MAQAQKDYVLRSVEERGVKFIQLWFSDVLGIPKSFQITPAELENALEEGMTFDGSAIDGFSRVIESDVIAMPDPRTFQILPTDSSMARILCDINNLDGSPFEGCPRNVLRRVLEQARKAGYSFFASPELEYFYFRTPSSGTAPDPLDFGSYFELTVSDFPTELRKQTVLAIEEMGIPVEYSQHEDAPSQHEIDLRYTDALTMADNIVTVKLLAKQIAVSHGVHASFMPKPLQGVQGSGMHTHFSLFSGESNAFFDPDDSANLSPIAKGFIAGLMRHAEEISAVTNQWVNSYKRLVVGYEAPVYVSWARNNRSALIRVPRPKLDRPDSTRIEYRALDPACNPYLAFALVLAAGMKGISEGYQLDDEQRENLFEMSPKELRSKGIVSLPTNLDEAIRKMEGSELVQETLGEHVFEWFIRNKRDEWAAYKTQVTQFELDRYFRVL
ncbi:MAG: glutamine synthetase [Acidimicrobiaceae bacterium]|nr:glutamine synthetase [Acidimicrobiaceae bacterium]